MSPSATIPNGSANFTPSQDVGSSSGSQYSQQNVERK